VKPAGAAGAVGKVTPAPIRPAVAEAREYPFAILERRLAELAPAGVRVISFSAGDPREATPGFIREALRDSVPEMSSYPRVAGRPELREACAAWLGRRFGVTLDPRREVLALNGSKEGVFFLPFALVEPGAGGRDTVVIPSPAYPVYEVAARMAGARVHLAPLGSHRGWIFDPADVPDAVWSRTALLWLNSPHNPTGAVASLDALAGVIETARRHGFWVASDEAYSEIYFDERPHSALECGAENVIAFHTLSKRSAMTGYRSGFMAGDERLIRALERFRPNIGVSTPDFVQSAAIAAWNDDAHPDAQRARYAEKRRLCLGAFERLGWKVEASEASFYLWLAAPGGDDVAFVERLMRRGLVALPGSFLGDAGKGYVRWALVPTPEDCREAITRLEGLDR
jgi:acetylornithine aminotransferase